MPEYKQIHRAPAFRVGDDLVVTEGITWIDDTETWNVYRVIGMFPDPDIVPIGSFDRIPTDLEIKALL